MTSVDEAAARILAEARPIEPRETPLGQALGRVLRQDACADLDQPPFDTAAMDGYAARRADLAQPLRLVGESPAGTNWGGTLGPGECVRILTGAPVPAGADCVVRQEDVSREGSRVRVLRPSPANHIRTRGENRRAGELVLPAGTRLGPPELAALAAIGVTRPLVSRAVRCAHLATGDELVAPDQRPAGAQIRDSNSTLVAALVAAAGAELVAQHRVNDDPISGLSSLGGLPAHDVLLVSGGAGAGDRDPARGLLRALGYELIVESVNLRPGKPLLVGRRDGGLAFVLPGNPVSHWVVFHLFIAPLLRALETGRAEPRRRIAARLAPGSALPPPDARATFWPCRTTTAADGVIELSPLALASSGDSTGLVGANGLLPLPPASDILAPGQSVAYLPCP